MSKEKINVVVDFQTSFGIETLQKEDSDTKTTIAKQYYREIRLFLGNDIECICVNPWVILTDKNGRVIKSHICKTAYNMKALLSYYKNDYELSNVNIKIHHQSHPFYHITGGDILFPEVLTTCRFFTISISCVLIGLRTVCNLFNTLISLLITFVTICPSVSKA